jgi:hypothetical protein
VSNGAYLAKQGEPVAWNCGVPPLHPQQKEGETFIVSYEEPQPKQEQGEPVAWRDRNSGTLLHEEWLDADPLYTTPQQRKPLTNKQLFEHWQVAKVSDMTHAEIDIADYVLIVRDVEALHGIKE